MTLCTGRPQPYVEALMKVLDIRYPADALTLLWHQPPAQPGLSATTSPGALRLDAWFEGRGLASASVEELLRQARQDAEGKAPACLFIWIRFQS
mgnify:CR=1 FL=1